MSPGTGVDPGHPKRVGDSVHLHYHSHFPGDTAVHTHKLAKSMPTSASCLKPLNCTFFRV